MPSTEESYACILRVPRTLNISRPVLTYYKQSFQYIGPKIYFKFPQNVKISFVIYAEY